MKLNVMMPYRSSFDGASCAMVITGFRTPSENRKTGDMLQVWYMPYLHRPNIITPEHQGAVCGTCDLMGAGCYVGVKTLCGIYDALLKNRYQEVSIALANRILCGHIADGGTVRDSAWGDAASMPALLHADVFPLSKRITRYTHAWKLPQADHLRGIAMASCTTMADAVFAQHTGWPVFMARSKGAPVPDGMRQCRAKSGVQCADCLLCNGIGASISTEVHGYMQGSIRGI
jgi:hypothetical protein